MMEQSLRTQPVWLRILQFPFIRLIVLGAGLFYLMGKTESFIQVFNDSPAIGVAIAVGMALVAMAIYIAWGKIIERRDVTELSCREWAANGPSAADRFRALHRLRSASDGVRHVHDRRVQPDYLHDPGRGHGDKIVGLRGTGISRRAVQVGRGHGRSWIAIIVSSLVFGFLHLLNPDATIAGATYIAIEAGLLLAAMYLATRRLWMAIGFHMLWNYVQSGRIFRHRVGRRGAAGPASAENGGADLLHGRQLRHGAVDIRAHLVHRVGIVMLVIAVRRGHMIPAPWSRKR